MRERCGFLINPDSLGISGFFTDDILLEDSGDILLEDGFSVLLLE